MTETVERAQAYARENGARFLDELFEMLRMPSVGADPAYAADTRRNAEWLAAHLAGLGLDKACVMETAGHPLVYGEWLGAGRTSAPCLMYGHYDIVPAVMEDGWEHDPFEPVIKDGKIYARGRDRRQGAALHPGQGAESYLKTGGAAPVNVKILLEGEEEVSSPNLVPWIKEHADLIRADVCVISDSSMASVEEPAITHSLRGMTYIEVEVQGPREDLHSGFWGGATHNPALALVEILGKLYNADGTIAVPGFYDDVVPLTEAERAMLAKVPLTEEQFKAATGVPAVWGDANYTIRERVSARPTLDINGLWSGYSGPGPKTIIPVRAGGKISSRLVGNQDAHKIFELIKQAIEDCDAADGEGGGAAAHDWQACADPLRLARNAGRGTRVRAGLGPCAGVHPWRRQHPDRGRAGRPAEDPGGDDGLRAGHGRLALAQRALPHRHVRAGHPDGHRVPGRAGAMPRHSAVSAPVPRFVAAQATITHIGRRAGGNEDMSAAFAGGALPALREDRHDSRSHVADVAQLAEPI